MGCCSSSSAEPRMERSSRPSLYVPRPYPLPNSLRAKIRIGRLADFYTKEQEIGFGDCHAGTYGTVFHAFSREFGHICAVKRIDRSLLSKGEVRATLQEAVLLRSLSHPNIIRLYDFVLAPDSFNIVTELCTGGNLYERLARKKRLSERTLADFMRQLLSAVAYCHKKHIVHRDIKLENILLETSAVNSTLKLIDFGTATHIAKGRALAQMSGTPYFVAPEVLERRYTEKCDIWSCGVVLYMMLAGHPPFPGSSRSEIFRNIRTGRLTFTAASWQTVSEAGKDLVAQMMRKDADGRPSAEETLRHRWFSMWTDSDKQKSISLFRLIGTPIELIEPDFARESKDTNRSEDAAETAETEGMETREGDSEAEEWRQRLERVDSLLLYYDENKGNVDFAEAHRRFEGRLYSESE